jgi:hypothetical protein
MTLILLSIASDSLAKMKVESTKALLSIISSNSAQFISFSNFFESQEKKKKDTFSRISIEKSIFEDQIFISDILFVLTRDFVLLMQSFLNRRG